MLENSLHRARAAILFSAASVYGQTASPPSITQRSTASPCSNIVATGNVNCAPRLEHQKSRSELRRKTDALADEILAFDYAREGEVNSWMQQAVAQAYLDAFDKKPNGSQDFHTRKRSWDQETQARFLAFYWPKVTALENELVEHGVDVSPIARAVALDGPRKTGLMLSVVASRIGVKPPFLRVVTPTEALVLARSVGMPEVEIYAVRSDSNCVRTAAVLQQAFRLQQTKVNQNIIPLDPKEGEKNGIHLVYPSADWTTVLNNFIPTLQQAELELTWEVKPTKQPPSILKIEIWPESANWHPHTEAPSLVRRSEEQPK